MQIKLREPERYEGVETRVQLAALAMAFAFAALVFGFWRVQVLHMREFQEMAEENRVRSQRIASDRGPIFARGGVVVADNRAAADIVFVPGECPKDQLESVGELLERLIDVPRETLLNKARAAKGEPFMQMTIKRDVTKADRVRVEEHSYALPGVATVVHPQRRYLQGKTGGQLLGYLGEINQVELDRSDRYHMGDLIGRSGLEQQYEQMLHGNDGYMLVTKYASGLPQLRTDRHGVPYIARLDSLGQLLSEEGSRRMPTSGKTLNLTLDLDLQAHCETILGTDIGSIAVLDADTGEVLALASTPTYDPSIFVTRGRKEERLALLKQPQPNPMANRACREIYPPGSVFKVMLASAALEEGVINRNTSYFCPGQFQIGGKGRAWHCWRHSGHGSVGVIDALAFSCDVFFYNVGLALGPDKIAEWGRRFGLGVKTGIDLPAETAGLLPDRAWKEKLFAGKPQWERNWYPGDTVNLSIGQGSCATTPLQNAVLMACIANGGYRVTPHLNREANTPRSEPFLSQKTLDIVREGMRKCVAKGQPAPSGTGHAADIAGMEVIGKTGSAQVAALEVHQRYANEEDIPYEMRDHAWFVSAVLDRKPRLAICILVEHGLHGSSTAAPLAKEIFEHFYNRQKPGELKVASEEGTH